MDELNEQQQQRLEKIQVLQDKGLRPFGTSFSTTHALDTILQAYSALPKEELEATPISCKVAGRIIAMRRFGKGLETRRMNSANPWTWVIGSAWKVDFFGRKLMNSLSKCKR
jgi:lysyl-tRNA synthetase class II